ncbi:MAG: hypothetical protein ACUVWP_08790, partial [bacterium]
LLSIIFSGVIYPLSNLSIYNDLYYERINDSKTYEIYYDNNDDWNVAYTFQSVYINEPFENGFGFYFDLDDFDVFKNIDEFKIIEIKAFLILLYSQKTDEESR